MTSVIVAVLLLFAWPQQTPNASASAQRAATAYFYMTSGVLGSSDVSVDGRVVCRLESGKYCTVQVEPGAHTIATSREWWGYSFEFASGKPYYFKLEFRASRSGGYTARVDPVDPDLGEVELHGCTKAGTDRL